MSKDNLCVVTTALPYANGHLHLGHLLEHIQTDSWVRSMRMAGKKCYAICGDDAHGTPIMLKAEQLNITPEEMIREIQHSHESDFKEFDIVYDHYHTTHSEENRELVEQIYQRLLSNGDIVKQTIKQAYDTKKQMFLPDRYVKGNCPCCKSPDQYGDNCEVCGSTYGPMDLGNPISVISGEPPIIKESEHYFFDLNRYKELLHNWLHDGHVQEEVTNKLDEWFKAGLKMWDISRDAPYFGFTIPGTTDKYFYVWLDAPIGYMASYQAFCKKNNLDFNALWGKDSTAELYHIVGKDIIYFHALFWPAILAGSQHRLPTAVYAHGFLTVNGQKMSKSRGTFIEAQEYLKHLDPNYLRYYLASKMNGKIEDIDINFDDFIQKNNSDLVGKIVNIASRCQGFIHKNFGGMLASEIQDPVLYKKLIVAMPEIETCYLKLDFAAAVRIIMELADEVNQYIDHHKPWQLAKDINSMELVHLVATQSLNAFRILIAYLKPIIPALAENSEKFLNNKVNLWTDLSTPLLNHKINEFSPLITRVEKTAVDALLGK